MTSTWRSAKTGRVLERRPGRYPDLFYTGYTQDALKEFVEANVTCALIQNRPLLTPGELDRVRSHLPERPGRSGGRAAAQTLIYCGTVTPRKPNACSGSWTISTRAGHDGLSGCHHQRPAPPDRPGAQHHRKDARRYHFSLRGEHLEQAIGRLSAQLNGGEPRRMKAAYGRSHRPNPKNKCHGKSGKKIPSSFIRECWTAGGRCFS